MLIEGELTMKALLAAITAGALLAVSQQSAGAGVSVFAQDAATVMPQTAR